MLMRSDNGSVHIVQAPIHLGVGICLLLQALEDALSTRQTRSRRTGVWWCTIADGFRTASQAHPMLNIEFVVEHFVHVQTSLFPDTRLTVSIAGFAAVHDAQREELTARPSSTLRIGMVLARWARRLRTVELTRWI